MLQFGFANSFANSLKRLDPVDKIEAQRRVDVFMLALDARQIPAGFGLKKLQGALWELRIDLSQRVLFHWKGSAVTFLFVGNHHEISLFLKHF